MQLPMNIHSKKGFTLIELLVVISIIAILSVIGITVFSGVQKGARDARRRADLLAIRNSLEAYHLINNSYPLTGGVFWSEGRCTSTNWTVKPDYTGANAYIPNLSPNYISNLPGDPNVNGVDGRCYIYRSEGSPDGSDYTIATHFGAENTYAGSDPMIRYIAPACTTIQPTFTMHSAGGRCW